jgi:hypothetical protein
MKIIKVHQDKEKTQPCFINVDNVKWFGPMLNGDGCYITMVGDPLDYSSWVAETPGQILAQLGK